MPPSRMPPSLMVPLPIEPVPLPMVPLPIEPVPLPMVPLPITPTETDPLGMIFVPYGPPTCRLMGGDTDGTGMPTSKGWEVEVVPV